MNKYMKKRQAISILTTIMLTLIITLTISPIVASAAAPNVTASKLYSDYTENNLLTVDSNIIVIDGDANVTGAKVAIGDGYVSSEDTLEYATINGISGSWDSTKGILTLTGDRSGSDYQAAFRNVKYNNSNDVPNTAQRNITFALGGNSLHNPDNQHYYEYVSANITWGAARTAASTKTFYGLQGYLATITSAEENTFIKTKVSQDAWIGANDSVVEGDWRWVTGPEGTEAGGQGRQFWQGVYGTGSIMGGEYNNWDPIDGEPNDWLNGAPGEDYAYMIASSGTWNDYPITYTRAYFVEYGGMPGDPTLNLTAMITVNVTAVNDAPTVPGAFASPMNGQEKNGAESMTVSWGTSTDPEGATVYYDLWYFNGTWTQIGDNLSSTSMAYTLPDDDTNSAMFRVYANDTDINSSAREVTFAVIDFTPTTPTTPTNDLGDDGGIVNPSAPLPDNVESQEIKGAIFDDPVSSAELKFKKGYVTLVIVDAEDTMSKVRVKIQELAGKSPEIKVNPPSGAIHSYHDIDLELIENGELAGATIQFRAEKKWIADNGGDRNAVVVMRYHDDWMALETKPIGEDDEYVFFSARTPGFSTFAITMKLDEEVASMKVETPESIIEEIDESTPVKIEPKEEKSYWWLVLVIVAIVGMIFFVYKNKKDKSRE